MVRQQSKILRTFVALDLETANSNPASICQIGIASFVDGELAEEWVRLVDPESDFFDMNISIHGITEQHVQGAVTYPQLAPFLHGFLSNRVVVAHTTFDRTALNRASRLAGIDEPDCRWLDSALVARRAWTQYRKRGYGLKNICSDLGYEFQHHDALEDAKAAGHIMLAAMEHSGEDIHGWLDLVKQRQSPRSEQKSRKYEDDIKLDGDPGGPLAGEVIVFTGKLTMSRAEAAKIAAVRGCIVDKGVTQRTTILVVGDQDLSLLAGHKRSSKHRRAEELGVEIFGESEFIRICSGRLS